MDLPAWFDPSIGLPRNHWHLAGTCNRYTMTINAQQRELTAGFVPRPVFVLIIALLQSGCSLFGIRSAEEAGYTILVDQDRFQVRQYKALVVAETVVDKSFDEAGKIAFKRLFGYISGANRAQAEIAMTAPVMALDEDSTGGEKISMTAPVTGEKSTRGWRFAFVLPAEYSLQDAPVPTNPDVNLALVPARKVAVLRYTGSWSEPGYRSNLKLLQDWMHRNQFEAASLPRVAGYDPPWTLPFLRRNEVLIDIKS